MRHVAALSTALLLLGGCATAGTASPAAPADSASPRETDARSPAATLAASATASAAAGDRDDQTLALGPDVIAEVVTTDLVMRTAPAITPESIVYSGRLGPGDRLYLVEGPRRADGYDWYLAAPYQARVNQEADASSTVWVAFGWVAAADRTGESWIVPIEPECPAHATVEALHALYPLLRLACFGDVAVSVEGNVSCHDLGPPIPTPAPDWLTWNACHINPSDAPAYDWFDGRTDQGIAVHYPPGAERVTGSLRITGHFDDPRAAECEMHIPTEESDVYGQELRHRTTQLGCRAGLVVDSTAIAP